MNAMTRCSGHRNKSNSDGVLLCPLRDSCALFKNFKGSVQGEIYEIVPPFIGSQCDHYTRLKPQDQR